MRHFSPSKPKLADELAQFGAGVLAYIKPIAHDDARRLVGDMGEIPVDLELYCLFGADGTPLAISDSQAMAIENALEYDLHPVFLH